MTSNDENGLFEHIGELFLVLQVSTKFSSSDPDGLDALQHQRPLTNCK